MENNTEALAEAKTTFDALQGVPRFAVSILITIVAVIVVKIVIYLISRALKRTEKRSAKFTPIMCNFTIKVVRVICWVIGILFVLQVWGLNLGPVIAGLGVTGIVLGFALQESISSFFSGFMLILNDPFEIGDYVTIGDYSGTVKDMDMMSVTLVTPDNKRITMANKLVWGNTITNFSAMDTRRVDLTVTVPAGTDVDKAKGVFSALLATYPDVLPSPAPTIEVTEFLDSGISFVVRPWCENSKYWDLVWKFQHDIPSALAKEGIEIPHNKLYDKEEA